jgi:hypothetical protein
MTEQEIASIKREIKTVLENVGCLGNKDSGADNYHSTFHGEK